MAARMNRRLFGMLSKRLDELEFDRIDDARDDRGKRWRLGTLLRATLGAMIEDLSERMSQPTRRLLGIRRRLPDTTLRNALCTIEPDQLRNPLHALVRKAQRRKALEPNALPFGVVSLDGKGFSIPSTDDRYAQRQTQGEDTALTGIVRTVTATLTSSAAKPIIDVTSIPAPTNEMGVFERALDSLCCAYRGLDLFKLVTYDAGACSAHNATLVRARDLQNTGSVLEKRLKLTHRAKTSSEGIESCEGSLSVKSRSCSTAGSICAPCCVFRLRRSVAKPSLLTSAISSQACPACASPLTIGCLSLDDIGASRHHIKSSTMLSRKTITPGLRPVRVPLSS